MVGGKSREQERTRAVTLRLEGKSLRRIRTLTGHDPKFVKLWVGRFQETGSVADKSPRARAPRKLLPRVKQAIKSALVEKRGSSLRKAAARVTRRGMPVSHETVWKFAKDELGVYPYHLDPEVDLTPAQQKTRLEFAPDYVGKDLSYWKRVIMSDEKPWPIGSEVRNTKNDVFWTDDKRKVPGRRTNKATKTLLVWGAVSYTAKSRLVFFPDRQTQTAAFYRDAVITKGLLRDLDKLAAQPERSIFQQDKHPSHTAVATQELLEEKLPGAFFAKDEWPPKDVDINIVENVWGAMVDQMLGKIFYSRSALIAAVKAAWQKVPQKDIQQMYKSLPGRLRAIKRAGGRQIHP